MQEHAAHPQTDEAPEPSAGQMDDINIPLVAVSVAFFACLLAVSILSLQAWFMNADRAEQQRKTALQEDPRTYQALARTDMTTPLGQILQQQRAQLAVAPEERKSVPVAPAVGTTTASQPVKKLWIPIDTAMDLVSKDYSTGAKP